MFSVRLRKATDRCTWATQILRTFRKRKVDFCHDRHSEILKQATSSGSESMIRSVIAQLVGGHSRFLYETLVLQVVRDERKLVVDATRTETIVPIVKFSKNGRI
jgi:hypothetical protein